MKKNLKKQNIVQLGIALVSIVLLNYIASYTYLRLDLTSDKRYTLSEATKELLDSLDDAVYIEIYLDGEMPVGFQRMQKSIQELMDEFRVVAGANIQYQFINPSESNDQAKRNAIYNDLYKRGLDPTNVKERDKEGGVVEKMLFPGSIIAFKDKEVAVNLLVNNQGASSETNLNNSIEALEYKFVDAIRKITSTKRKRVAFIEGQGELDEFYTGDITKALSEYYEIDRVTIKEYINILNDYDAIIIAGPTDRYTEKSKFIIDQFIMNGGKALWFVESVNVSMDSLSAGEMTFALMNDVNLTDQLFKYGVRVNPNVIQDIQCALIPVNTAMAGKPAKFAPAPWLYFPLLSGSAGSPVTKNLNTILSKFPSEIDTVGNNPLIRKKIILASSVNSRLLNVPILVSLRDVNEKINPAEFVQGNKPIAIILEGQFPSVFKNRMINEYTQGQEFTFKEQSKETKMIVVSDADLIKNEVSRKADGLYITPLGYDRYTKQTYGNKEFVMNAVHYLIDDSGILDLRSREFKLRLLNKTRIKTERTKWQLINTVFPVLFIILFGIGLAYFRKRKYTM